MPRNSYVSLIGRPRKDLSIGLKTASTAVKIQGISVNRYVEEWLDYGVTALVITESFVKSKKNNSWSSL